MISIAYFILVVVSTFIVSLGDANAGAFATREQDTVGMGDAFAGVAAGGSIGSMYWNPATMTQTGGGGIDVNAAIIVPNVNQNPSAGSTFASPPFHLGAADDTTISALLPSAYSVWQLNPNLWFGLGINSPYGLQVHFQDRWAGRTYGLGARIATYNANPNLAVRITDWLEHFSIRLGVSRVREISVTFFFGNTFEKSGDCSPKLLNCARLHLA